VSESAPRAFERRHVVHTTKRGDLIARDRTGSWLGRCHLGVADHVCSGSESPGAF
jgi:hypothetical protein